MKYLTTPQAVARLGMVSRQAFHQSGIPERMEGIALGDLVARYVEIDTEARESLNRQPSTRLWPEEEVEEWADALHRRRGLIALGLLPPNATLVEAASLDNGLDWVYEIEPGRYVFRVAPEWDDDGPVGRIWCPEMGVVELTSGRNE